MKEKRIINDLLNVQVKHAGKHSCLSKLTATHLYLSQPVKKKSNVLAHDTSRETSLNRYDLSLFDDYDFEQIQVDLIKSCLRTTCTRCCCLLSPLT